MDDLVTQRPHLGVRATTRFRVGGTALLLCRAAIVVGVALIAGGCLGGASATPSLPASGSTRIATWVDITGGGILQLGPAEPMLPRTELAAASPPRKQLALFVQLTDAHVTDEESPARVEMLDRLGPPFTSAFRPQETLTAQVLAAMVSTMDSVDPQAVFETGDLIDNDQANELRMALSVLRGGRVNPNSGASGYSGVQAASNPDPLIYRPDVDAPRYPHLLAAAGREFHSVGLRAPWYPLPGNHDLLVQGNLRPTRATRAIAEGSRKLVSINRSTVRLARTHRLDPHLVERLLARGLPGHSIRVPADARRRELPASALIVALRRASGHGGRGRLMDSTVDLGPSVRAILIDTVNRRGGAAGVFRRSQARWLKTELRRSARRWVVVFSSTPLDHTAGGGRALAALDGDSRVVAAIAGDVHRNSIVPRRSKAGGYWLITTASLVDYPQQARAFRLMTTQSGGVVLETWMLNADPRSRLANISRQLAYLDFQGGRPRRLAGGAQDRNAMLYR